MDCAGVAEHLVGYHLGTLDEPLESGVEEHLVGCGGCLKGYLALKRAIGRRGMERPSPDVHRRLREELAQSFPLPNQRSRTQGLTRRVSLWRSVALAAIATSVVLALPKVIDELAPADVGRAEPVLDTSRVHAESLRIY